MKRQRPFTNSWLKNKKKLAKRLFILGGQVTYARRMQSMHRFYAPLKKVHRMYFKFMSIDSSLKETRYASELFFRENLSFVSLV